MTHRGSGSAGGVGGVLELGPVAGSSRFPGALDTSVTSTGPGVSGESEGRVRFADSVEVLGGSVESGPAGSGAGLGGGVVEDVLGRAVERVVSGSLEQVRGWRGRGLVLADGRAASAVRAAGEVAAGDRLWELFFRGFPELAGALDESGDLVGGDGVDDVDVLLPLVRVVLDPAAVGVTGDDVERLSGLAVEAARRGVVSVERVRELVGFEDRRRELTLTQVEVEAFGELLGVGGAVDGWERVVEAVGLYFEVWGRRPARADWGRLVGLHGVLSVLRAGFAGVVGPVGMAGLLPLVRRVLDPAAMVVDRGLVRRLVAGVEGVEAAVGVGGRGWGWRGVGVGELDEYFRRAAVRSGGVDGPEDRAEELVALRGLLPVVDGVSGERARARSEGGLRWLVETRRALVADPRSRGFTGVEVYAPLALGLLGVGRVTAGVLELLAVLAGRAAGVGRFRGVPSLAALTREAVAVSVGDGVVAGGGAGWSGEAAGPLPRGEGVDYNAAVPGQQYVAGISHVDELAGWVNAIVPGGVGGVDKADLRRTLTWSFAAALDEGVPFVVEGGDGKLYRVELFADVVAAPVRNEAVVVEAKLEQRLNAVDVELSSLSAEAWSGYAEVGGVLKAGVVAVSGTGTGLFGVSRGGGRSWGVATATGRYVYLKPDDGLGQLDVPVTWSARVTQVGSGRWKDVVWTDRFGLPRQEMVNAYVSKHLMPTGSPNRRLVGRPSSRSGLGIMWWSGCSGRIVCGCSCAS